MRAERLHIFIFAIVLSLSIGSMWSYDNIFTPSVHWPADGDRVTKRHYEYTELSDDSLVWDFSGAIETGASHSMQWINIGDTILVKKELGAQFTYNVENGNIIWNAYENPLLELTDSLPMGQNENCQLTNSFTSPYSFHGSYCKNNYVICNGILTTEISDSGILILPNDTVVDAVRIRQTADGTIFVSAGNHYNDERGDRVTERNINHTVTIDRWYSPAFRYELVECISDIYYFNDGIVKELHSTFMCPPEEQEYSLGISEDTGQSRKSLVKNVNKTDKNTQKTEMDEQKEKLCINLDNDRNVISIRMLDFSQLKRNQDEMLSGFICDQLGRVWKRFSDIVQDEDLQIPLDGLPKGYYIFHMSILGNTISKKLTIQ